MDKYLPILGIETSGDICSVCVYVDEKRFVEKNVMDKHIHSEKLFEIIEECSNDLKGTDEFRSIALSVGPGSFTGLRIGMAAAKGIAIGKNLPIIPVPTMDAFAFGLLPYLSEGNQFVIANNVNRDEIYFAKYKKNNNKIHVLQAPMLLETEYFQEHISDQDVLFGSYKFCDEGDFSPFPSSLNISRWAYFFGQELLTYNHDYLEPNYLKNFVAKVKK